MLRGPEDLHRLVVELVEDSAADGAVWTEVSVSASGFHRRLTGSDEATMELVCDAVAVADGQAGVVIGIDRSRDAEQPGALAGLAATWAGRGVVGLGLAGDERASCAPFARAAQIARDAGLQVVPHSGELRGPDSIREVLTVLRPNRLMHGVRAAEDPALVAELADRGVCLDLCPTSNVALGVVARLAEHPLPGLVRSGVSCSLNADNTLVFSTDLADEYRIAREALGLTDNEIATLARASLTASAAPAVVVAAGVAGIDDWLELHPGS
ncbi:adenosine deaminase family protein [Actinomycetospora sp. NBC_00405]|uniref:adenosine deaminase family protein n=1 Tax=Actinomycetospora sp. NBC_00405 TaxID=2975952 RepID=UPI002E1F7AF8